MHTHKYILTKVLLYTVNKRKILSYLKKYVKKILYFCNKKNITFHKIYKPILHAYFFFAHLTFVYK